MTVYSTMSCVAIIYSLILRCPACCIESLKCLEDELAIGAAMAKVASMKRNARNFILGVRRCRLSMLWFVLEF